MNKKRLVIFLCIVILFFTACGHYSKLVEVSKETLKLIPRLWLVTSLSLEQHIPNRDTEKKIPEILSLLGNKYNITVVLVKDALPQNKAYACAELWIKEQPYTRSLDQYNSIAALITIIEPESQIILARAFYSEESEDSLKSFKKLYLLLDELFAALAPNLDPQ